MHSGYDLNMPDESGIGKGPKNKAEEIADLEVKLGQIEATIQAREQIEMPADADDIKRERQRYILKDLKKMRDDYLEEIAKLKAKK